MLNKNKDKHCVAYWVDETGHEYRVDLYDVGVRWGWDSDVIWDVARREMKRTWNRPVTGWTFEK